MGSPPAHPLKTGHVVALVFGCLCPCGAPDLLEPLHGAACVQPAPRRLCPARSLPLRWLPHPICCRIPQHGSPQHLASLPLQRQGLKGRLIDYRDRKLIRKMNPRLIEVTPPQWRLLSHCLTRVERGWSPHQSVTELSFPWLGGAC